MKLQCTPCLVPSNNITPMKESDTALASCLQNSRRRKLENTQQRARGISTKASVWSSSTSSSNIWKHFFYPRLQKHAASQNFRPTAVLLWSGQRENPNTDPVEAKSISPEATRHAGTTDTANPTLDKRRGRVRSPPNAARNTPRSDCLLA